MFYFLQASQPWLQVDEQPAHVPFAQPQLESQEQAMVGCRKGSLVLDALESGSGSIW